MLLRKSGGRERRYSSAACLACRKRKIKCDNDRPRCSNCCVYDIDCVFGDDRRRTSSTMKTISALSSRLDGLEGLLTGKQVAEARKNTPPPATLPSSGTTLNPLPYGSTGSRGSPSASAASLGQLQDGPESQTRGGHYGEPDMDYWVQIAECPGYLDSAGSELQGGGAVRVDSDTAAAALDDGYDRQLVFVGDKDAPSPKRQCRPEDRRSNSDTSSQALPSFGIGSAGYRAPSTDHATQHDVLENELTAQLANRLGQLQFAEDGQLRYYGATSNLHMINHGLLSLFEPSIRTIRSCGDQVLRSNGLCWAGDLVYEEHLTNLYFSWHNPLLNEVAKEVYLREKRVYEAGHDTPYYSPTLDNAILAVGAAYSSRQHPGNHDDAAEFFGSRAKALLDIEIDSPTLATVQALLVLSGHEAARARDSRGWIYAGMAVQVVTDLGLHLSLEHDRMESNSTDGAGDIAQLRKDMFWATHTATTLWSSYSGRPFPMSGTQHSTPGPTRHRWEYYTDCAEQPTLPPDLDLGAANVVPMYMTQLAIKMGKTANILYNGLPELSADAHMFHAAMATELQRWKDALPASLHVDTSQDWRAGNNSDKKLYLPMVLQLHMQYHEALILLNRPFISQVGSSSPASSSSIIISAPSSLHSVAAAQCTASASAITRLIVLYRRQWGLQQINIQAVHVVMTAGIQHAHDCCVLAGSAARAARDGLHVCLQALGDMGQTFQSGNRGLQVVSSLSRDWQNSTLAARKRGRGF